MQRRDFIRGVGGGLAWTMLRRASAAAEAETGESAPLIKVGMIGTTHGHAAGKLAALRKLADLFQVVGVVEPDSERRALASTHPSYAEVNWLSEEQLLGTEGLQAVLVETGVRDFVPVARRCVEAGMHVHLEKPAGPELQPFRELQELAQSRRRLLQMGYMFRYNPAFQLAFLVAREGYLGTIYEIHGVIGKTISEEDRRQWSEFSGVSMDQLGCHLIDALVKVLGPPDEVHAFARHSGSQADDLTDNHLAVCAYPRALATVRSAAIDVEGTQRREFSLCGQQGSLTIRPLEPPRALLTLAAAAGPFPAGTHEVTLPAMSGRYDDQLREFGRQLLGQRPVDFSPDHDLAVHETLLKACGMMS